MASDTFIIRLPISVGDQERRTLAKSFRFAGELRNAVTGKAWERVETMKSSPEWQAAKALPKGREKTDAFKKLWENYRLSEYDLHADIAVHRRDSGKGHLLGINEAQKQATLAWKSVKYHILHGGRPRFVSRKRTLHSIESKTNKTGIVWKPEESCVVFCKHRYRVLVNRNDEWLMRALQDPADPKKPRKVKFCRIVRYQRSGKECFELQLIAEGTTPLKHAYAGTDIRMSVDPGLGVLTYALEDGTIVKLEIAPGAKVDWKRIRVIQRAMERSRQANNPNNYEVIEVIRNGRKRKSLKVKSGKLEWHFSERYLRLRAELAEILRRAAATREREHGEVSNWLLCHAGSIRVEDNEYRAFQKGRFGKAIGQSAPAALYTMLSRKAESAGLEVTYVKPQKLKPTQHNLLTGEFVKHELWERRVNLGAGVYWIDRDAASCINLLYADIENQTYDPKRLRKAVYAGVTTWLDAGIVVEQVYEGMSEREFRRFLRHGVKPVTVQGLRQKEFRGQDDGKSAGNRRRAES